MAYKFGRVNFLAALLCGITSSAAFSPCFGQTNTCLPGTPLHLVVVSAFPSCVANAEPAGKRVRELIPSKYRKRYLKWRSEYLSTAAGREEWQQFNSDPIFRLTITISEEQGEGAVVQQFHWDSYGRLTAATIVLGNKLDSGYPNPFNYPITCSLAPGNLPPEVRGTILAATKLAHEFGHLNRIMTLGQLYQRQNDLMTEYNEIFYSNGHNTHDARLVELQRQLEGTPVSVKQDREMWAEVGAILYLQERLGKSSDLKMPETVKQAIESYHLMYPGRA